MPPTNHSTHVTVYIACGKATDGTRETQSYTKEGMRGSKPAGFISQISEAAGDAGG